MLTIYILLCLIVFSILFYVIKNKPQYEQFNRIPGPKGKFIVGNALDFLMGAEPLFYYFRYLAKQYKDVCKLKLFHKNFMLVTHPQYVETLISGTQYNDKGFLYEFLRPWLREGLLLNSGAKWHQRRKILTPTFHYKVLQHFYSVLSEKSTELVASLQSEVQNSKTDIYPFLTDFTLKSICETAMGVSLDKETSDFSKRYKKAIHDLANCLIYRMLRVWMHPDFVFNLTKVGREQKRTLNLLVSFRNFVIKQRKQNYTYKETVGENENNKEDKKSLAMLDLLLEAEQHGVIDADGINEEVDTFMFEGHDTTATALLYIFLLLANHPEEQEKIVEEYLQIFGSFDRTPTFNELADMKYLEACIKESLRLYPPVYFVERKSDRPLKLGTYDCPAGTDYSILIYDLHRRSDQFIDPLKFNPERFLKKPTWHQFAYIPFSAGPRNCIGQKFAMMELKLAVTSVLRKFRLSPVTKTQDVKFIADIILRTTSPIYVKFDKR